MKQKRRLPFAPLIAGLVLLAAIGGAVLWWQGGGIGGNGAPRQGPLAGAPIGGFFRLIDGDGNVVTNDSLKGRWRLIYFGYTFCPDVCPVDAQRMGQGLKAFEAKEPVKALKIQPIFITVDPERDGPAAVKEFAQSFHPRMIGLTGTPKQVQSAMAVHRVYAQKQGKPGDVDYLVDHSTMIYLMDPQGRPVTYFARDVTPEKMAEELADYVG